MKTVISTVVLFFGIAVIVQAQLVTGAEAILGGEFYVVHSGIAKHDTLYNTSNIYIIKGTADTVWLFGAGYGDKSDFPADTSDIKFYKGAGFDASLNALADAQQVDSIITQAFGLNKQDVVLQFIAPHFHLDHLNQEFLAALIEDLNYPGNSLQILVHVKDSTGAMCNSYCCGNSGCSSPSSFFGAPFHPKWTMPYLQRFKFLGGPNDTCNHPVWTFTSLCGKWVALKSVNYNDGGHTDGSINLENSSLQLRLNGADGGTQCPLPDSWQVFNIHGNINIHVGTNEHRENYTITISPNPANNKLIIQLDKEQRIELTISLYKLNGQQIFNKTVLAGKLITINIPVLNKGIYLYNLSEAGRILKTGKLLIQ